MREHSGEYSPPHAWGHQRWLDCVWLVLLCAGSSWWCLSASPHVGVTYDERFYLGAGLDDWRDWYTWKMHGTGQRSSEPPAEELSSFWWGTGRRMALNGVMPLPIDAVTLPLFIRELRSGKRIDEPLEFLQEAREVTLIWLWLLLISALRLGRAAGGPWAGRIAAGLLAADPNILAHSALATTDICLAATLMAFTRAAYAGRSGGWWSRIALPGLWFGIAVLAKLSALLYGGLILVGFEVAHRYLSGDLGRLPGASLWGWARRAAGAALRSALSAAAVIAIGISLALIYCSVPQPGVHPLREIAKFSTDADNVELRNAYLNIAAQLDQVPYGVVTFAFQWCQNSYGRPSYLNGTFHRKGCWYYYPVLIAMKLPLPVILLGLATLVRPRAICNSLTLVALLMLLSSLTSQIQIGLRLVLPVVATGTVAIAVAVVRGFGRAGVVAGAGSIIVLAATSIWVWPHGLCYLNQLCGGPDAAKERVSDSNVDWGQGLPDLAEWRRSHGEPPVVVWYFGTDPSVNRPPFQQIRPEVLDLKSGDDLRAAVGPRILAVGATVVSMHPEETPAKAIALGYLRTRMPLARTATFTLYDFRDPSGPPPKN